MKRAEWIELIMIAAAGLANRLYASHFFPAMPAWQIVLGLSALLLAQSLVRDVAILLRRQRQALPEPQKEVQCMCLQSTIGMTGVIAGLACLGVGSSANVVFRPWELSLAIISTLVLGFVIKDLVISWNPLGIRREENHLNLIVRLKRK